MLSMNRATALLSLALPFALIVALPAPARAETPAAIATDAAPEAPSYQQVVRSVARMVGNRQARRLARARGLGIINVLWEDTGRYLGSSVGPNISDVTIEVQVERPGRRPRNYLMPVIRYPNFTDKTADVRLDDIRLRVGNHEEGGALETVSLRDLLADPTRYMSAPDKGRIRRGSLLAKRDTHALVSAQHAFLPIPQGGKATFYPVIFNYQSYDRHPAVLTILATRQGTSMTIIDNSRDTVSGANSWGQRLYFNDGGRRAPLMAERLADVSASGLTANGESAESLGEDANLLMLIQVPLKVRPPTRRSSMALGGMADGFGSGSVAAESRRGGGGRSDVDRAVLGHGPSEGPFTELGGLTIARDPRFPVRVTVQFYQATSNGVLDAHNVAAMAGQIQKIYASADYVGSLVVPREADLARPTLWSGATAAPESLTWLDFPGLVARYQTHGEGGFRPLLRALGVD